MSKPSSSELPRLTHEQRLAAAGQFERANQVIATGSLDYGIQLLRNCCSLDPGNLTYRQVLRKTQKAKYKNNLKGQPLAPLLTLRSKLKLKAAQKNDQPIRVLALGEEILMRNPWDVGAHLAMAEAFEELELTGLAIWTLDQIRQVDATNPKINRPLARLFERTGNYGAAIKLWEKVRLADPTDVEAQRKHKDLAASDTIAKGGYEGAVQGTSATPVMGASDTGDDTSFTTSDQEIAADIAAATPGPAAPSHTGAAKDAAPNKDQKVSRDVAALQAKIQINPTNANAYLHLAAVYRRADQFEQAHQVLQGGLVPTGNNFEIAMELVDLAIEPFRRDLAIAEDKLKRHPNDTELQAVRAGLVKEIATRELDYFHKKADRFPTEGVHRFEMGVRLLQCGQIDEAIQALQAIRTDPRFKGKALVYLGYCFQNRNNWRLAQRNFEEALTHLTAADEKLRKEILYQLAKGYAEIGELTRAVDMACELANVDFSYKDIGKLLDEWNTRMQKA